MKKILILLFPLLIFPYSKEFEYKVEEKMYQILNNNPKAFKTMSISDENGNIYFEYNEKEVRALASLTKIMTALLILEDIDENRYDINTLVKVTKLASKIKYGIVLKENREYNVEDLLKLILLNSSNSAAYLLAEFSSNGNIDIFVNRMNNKAKELGLRTLKFYTPHGLPPIDTNKKMDVGNSRDILKLAMYVLNYDKIKNIVSNHILFLNDGTKIMSTNPLIKYENRVKGLKTGYHKRAMYNIIYYVEFNNNEKIIQVIMGSDSIKTREYIGKETISLMEE